MRIVDLNLLVCSREHFVGGVAHETSADACQAQEDPHDDAVNPEHLPCEKQVPLTDQFTILLVAGKVIAGANFAGRVKAPDESHDNEVEAVEHESLVQTADEVPPRQQAFAAENG